MRAVVVESRLVDAELGPVRFCSGCDEYWPEDGEFWSDESDVCRACSTDAIERRRAMNRERVYRHRARKRERGPWAADTA